MSKNAYFGKDDITPDFLRSVEKSAENSPIKYSNEGLKTEISKARLNEEKPSVGFKYTGHGKSIKGGFNSSNKKGLKGHLKKGSPAFMIIGLIIGAVVFMFTMVGNLGNQIETLITRATDTMFGSYSENSIRVTEELLAGKRGDFPDYFEERLNAQGIKVAGTKETGYSLDWAGIPIDSKSFREVYSNDSNFREAFTKAKRGRTSNFFDSSANFAYTRLGISRNLYRKYRKTNNAAKDKKSYKKVQSDHFNNSTKSSLNTVTDQQKTGDDGKPVYDENGKPVYENSKTGDNVTNSQGGNSKAKAKSYLADISGRVATATNVGCGALKVANMVSISIAAAEIYQSIHFFLSNAENFSKTKAGEGNYAAQSEVLNFITEPVTTTYIDNDTGEEKEITGAPIEAEGFGTVLAGTSPDLNKTKNYSTESAFMTTSGSAVSTALTALGITAFNHRACGGLRAVGAIASIAVGVFSGGIVSSIATVAKITFLNAGLGIAIAGALSALIPRIASALFENAAESLAGIPAGETFVKGAALSNKKVARSSSGQMLADKETATAYSRQIQIANAYEAELERKNKSPFDATSPDTFLGQLTTKFGFIANTNSLIGSVSAISNITGNIVANLLGSTVTKTFASDKEQNIVESSLSETEYSSIIADEKTCQNLTDIGAACGVYGEEITATHPDVINLPSDDPGYLKFLEENVKKLPDGTYEVIPNRFLANKIMYCDERDSPFGVYDSNIANALNTSLGFIDHIPILGDVIDIANAVEEMSPENEGWARGNFCVMNKNTNPHFKELLYAQHFTEDQRIAAQIELDETKTANGSIKNPTVAFKEAWYEVNPIDTSEAGLLARYTGTTKQEAEEVIALIDYYNFLANYEPPQEEEPEYHLEISENAFNDFFSNILSLIEYADLRNRSYAA